MYDLICNVIFESKEHIKKVKVSQKVVLTNGHSWCIFIRFY